MALVDKNTSEYGKCCRLLVDELSLHNLGNDVGIPMLAIIGSQSAGKSSVIVALSGIPLPRASGTCTRCPTQVRIFESDQEWTCKITLLVHVGEDGNTLPKPKIYQFGKALTDKEAVRERIMHAQSAILNPKKREEIIKSIESDEEVQKIEKNELNFSEDRVCLEVSGKDMINLTLIDLPGIIATTGLSDNQDSVKKIQQLVHKTIKQENCLILVTIAMTTDYENQAAVEFAKMVDPHFQRTLGVLTKPDMVKMADLRHWLEIIAGEKFPMLHGYYVVKSLDSDQLQKDIPHDKARELEQAYFDADLWKSEGNRQDQCGSKKLGIKLQELFQSLTLEKLPGIIAKVRRASSKVDEDLTNLPTEVTENAAKQHLHELLQNVSKEVVGSLSGKITFTPFVKPYRLLVNSFRQDVYQSRPIFKPFTKEEILKEAKFIDKIPLKEVEKYEEDDIMSQPEAGKENTSNLDTIRAALEESGLPPLPFNTPWQVKEHLMKNAVQDLPEISIGFYNKTIELLVEMVKLVTQKVVAQSSNSLLNSRIEEILLRFVDEEAHNCYNFLDANNKCETEVISTLNDHYYCDKKEFYRNRLVLERHRVLFKLKAPPPFSFLSESTNLPPNKFANTATTFNFGPASSAKSTTTAMPTVVASNGTANTQTPQSMALTKQVVESVTGPKVVFAEQSSASNQNAGSMIKPTRLETRKEEDELRKGSPSVIEEIEVASEVRAYWQTVFKRFVDYNHRTLDFHLLRPIREKCLKRLCAGFNIFGDLTSSQAHAYLREPEAQRNRRNELQLRKIRLDNALKAIRKLQGGDYDLTAKE
ncbi:uncharacterized protein FA14DRAFT_178776 [Meira miltonrushii]|uniref:P-loop containing nucleoside triphosphate hydrolase protein n=1 Tax=Meira miltonrushii TaxID=1280837 RepID=A0A316VEA6_9BASI|nr:uncharacterized protein FA14DRAFT_178776 [Meira miltonrushii]PWN35408.1 hypothetical protein FA14DRAFT_178776 [Meira miltonrushii]